MRFSILRPAGAALAAVLLLNCGHAVAADYPSVAASPGFSSTASATFIYCLAFGNQKVVRSDLIPLTRRPLPVVETAWISYVQSEYPDVASRRCYTAKSSGKAAAYLERDGRVRDLVKATGAPDSIKTGWAG